MSNNGTERLRYNNVKREQAAPVYTLTTTNVQDFIQRRLNMLVSELRKSDERFESLPEINIQVCGTQASKNFVPLCVTMPSEVLEMNSLEADDEILPLYFDTDEDGEAVLYPEFETFFKMYAYNTEDLKDITKATWIRSMGITHKIAEALKYYSIPRFRKYPNDDTRPSLIMMFIDPTRVFHDMLVDEDYPNRAFIVDIKSVKKVRDGLYEYRVTKLNDKNKKNKKNSASFFREIDGALINAKL